MHLMSIEPTRQAMATKVPPRVRHLFKALSATLDPDVLGVENTMENVLSLILLRACAQQPDQLARELAGHVGRLAEIEGGAPPPESIPYAVEEPDPPPSRRKRAR